MTARHITPAATRSEQKALWRWMILLSIMLLGIFLRCYRLESTGSDYLLGNSYYAAAVKSMIQSPYNFWYAAAEPGGAVTVDKPAFGLWFQGISALLLGINSLALALPQAAAGILCIALIYAIVRRQGGETAGLLAAFVYTIMPVSIAIDRNNTMDSILMLFLLLATLAFTKAIKTNKLRWLLAGGLMLGLGFNVKMLQAFLIVPALILFYLLGAQHHWWKKLLYLAAMTLVLLSISFSWALAVDLTPPEDRPYVGGSINNSVTDLALGYNGIVRLFGRFKSFPGVQFPDIVPPELQRDRGRDFYQEVGMAGVWRLFTQPLVGDVSWLLPAAVLAGLFAFFKTQQEQRFSQAAAALMLWGSWLLLCMIFFSISGMMHAYYVVMLGPPVAALTGIGLSVTTEQVSQHRLFALIVLVTVGITTLAFQIYVINAYPELRKLLIPALVLTGITGLILLLSGYSRPAASQATLNKTIVWIGALMLAPCVWSMLTTFNPHPDMILPRAGLGPADDDYADFVLSLSPGDNYYLTASIIIDYLQPRTEEQEYLLATWKAFDASPFILETGRPVMIMGGFTGLDPVMEMKGVIASVEDGSQRYFLFTESNPMKFWFDMNCEPVDLSEIELQTGRSIPLLTTDPDRFILYDCKQ